MIGPGWPELLVTLLVAVVVLKPAQALELARRLRLLTRKVRSFYYQAEDEFNRQLDLDAMDAYGGRRILPDKKTGKGKR